MQIPPITIDDLFVHRFQTDQILVVLQNRQYQYIGLSEDLPKVVKIPPFVPHGAINLSLEPAVLVNALLRHGAAHERDYQPLARPFAYDLEAAKFKSTQQCYPTSV